MKSMLLTILLGVSVALLAVPANAATLNQVTGFGSNPGNLVMYHHKPDGLANGHAVVVLLHGCTQKVTVRGAVTAACATESRVALPAGSAHDGHACR